MIGWGFYGKMDSGGGGDDLSYFLPILSYHQGRNEIKCSVRNVFLPERTMKTHKEQTFLP